MSDVALGVFLRPQAVADLEGIWRYSVEAWNPQQADTDLDQINDKLQLLAENPTLGVAYSHVTPALRRYQVGRHGVFYRVAGTQLIVIRVLHDRMDAPRQLDPHAVGD